MADEEIRRRKTADPEMDALVLVAQALAPLDHETCARVLKWAEDRFIEQPKREVAEMAWVSVDAQIQAYQKFAKKLGVDDVTLAHALKHVRQTKQLAPIEDDPDPEATIARAIEEINR